jgi:hypothetical protein
MNLRKKSERSGVPWGDCPAVRLPFVDGIEEHYEHFREHMYDVLEELFEMFPQRRPFAMVGSMMKRLG